MFGQPASWQTVCRPSDFTRDWSAVYSGPIRARVLIHSGLRSIGVAALRASRRSSLRPSACALTAPSYGGRAHDRGTPLSGDVPAAEADQRDEDSQQQEHAEV